jgi:glyoxylase-like metal-dependent hydrolase (beta-lactamase superfamily II)
MNTIAASAALVAGLSVNLQTGFATHVPISEPVNNTTMKTTLTVEVIKGNAASVNSYLFSNGKSAIVMDVLRSSTEAADLAERIRNKHVPLTHILITHGHPDHYIGMDVLHKAFPEAKIVVASAAIKADIKGFSQWMESVGWLDGEPNLKPKTDKNRAGFDYDGLISVLPANTLTLDGGGTLQLDTHYNPAEAEHLTTVYSPDLNALFTADFCYNGVHLWLGAGVDQAHIQNWKDQLAELKSRYSALNPTIYPGHGDKADLALFDTVTQYITTFQRVTAAAKTKQEASAEMQRLYPTWQQADFLLHHSVDFHVHEAEAVTAK